DYRSLVAGGGTLVMLMGMERLASIVQKLLANGADRDLPVALVRWGTTGLQQTLTGTLESIVNASLGFQPPAVAVFGRVVELRAKLKWFERRPLFGLRIVVTRARKQASGLSAKLRMLGADVCELPTIRVEPPENLTEFGELVRDAGQYDWLLFTSVNGVDSFFEIFYRLYTDARRIGNVKIAAIGPATAQRIKRFHLAVDFQPKVFIAEAIVDGLLQFGSVENLKFLVVRALGARGVLPKRLMELGAIVDEAIAYRTVPETNDTSGALERFKATGADVVTFTSSSTVENFLALKLPWPAQMKTASIGPITSKTMRKNHLPIDVEAAQYDVDGLIEAVLKLCAK
ncbi:MAG: uroporphyrinogen-III synthase, partial [Verrucomicrobia bacterium]|nr:uroporphyrinogen-III synthase [Verrucomicrobiota bacterium]